MNRFPSAFLLFARPSFLGGVGDIFDFGNTRFIYNESLLPEYANHLAIKSDWLAVGNDIQSAIAQTRAELQVLARHDEADLLGAVGQLETAEA